MKLIDTGSLQLYECPPDKIPAYAILSHTWTKEEVSFAEYGSTGARSKAGYRKIKGFCRKAKQAGYAWAWVDTCCIDKSSSAELSEAINSMYRWYQDAGVCFVYLDDVPAATAFSTENASSGKASFDTSGWFTRGFTLQELLAPSDVSFFSQEWEDIGSKMSLAGRISTITRIPEDILRGKRDVYEASVSQRMSWASERNTTRREDVAYCLMGIFDVNMPMLYGEGDRAFRRLQEEIMRTSSDQTIFAWEHVEDDPQESGLLAKHPRNFKNSAHFEDKTQLLSCNETEISVSTSSRGIQLNVFLLKEERGLPLSNKSWCRLRCAEYSDPNKFAMLVLRDITGVNQKPEYVRVKPPGDIRLQRSQLVGIPTNILVRHNTHQAKVEPFRHRRVKVNITAIEEKLETRVMYNVKYPGPFCKDRAKKDLLNVDKSRIGNEFFSMTSPMDFEYALPLMPSTEVFIIIFYSKTTWNVGIGIRVSLDQRGQLTYTASSPALGSLSLQHVKFVVDPYDNSEAKQFSLGPNASLAIRSLIVDGLGNRTDHEIAFTLNLGKRMDLPVALR